MCEFDGRFSLAKLRGEYFLFARANVVAEVDANGDRRSRGTSRGRRTLTARPTPGEGTHTGDWGGRFVQVARAPRLGGPWGRFSRIRVEAFRPARDANVYFAAVMNNPLAA